MPDKSKMQPQYLKTFHSGRLQEVADTLSRLLASCFICPRRCRVNRLGNKKGFCKTGLKASVYSFLLHHGEEPPISGERGSGTIFFSHCNMGCVYCQNFEFSQLGQGDREVEPKELAAIMLELQGLGAHNINLVTPTHVLPQILQALCVAIPQGLSLPLVYNTSGYEVAEIIKLLDGVVDIYLPDMRYADEEQAARYSCAPGYPEYNRQAVKEMHRQVGVARLDEAGIIEKGVIIRHLVLPKGISGTEKIMRFIASELSPHTYISLMSQYFPCYEAQTFKDISRRITQEEYALAQKAMSDAGLYNGWVQEGHGLDSFAGINIKPKH
jgi:putative pyruvate formate lyase activating enzyme